jgi:eukaryotic-like serine/threonine-protein kinase
LMPGQDRAWPIWTPDGSRLTVGGSGPPPGLISMPAAGGPIEQITNVGGIPGSWSSDAKTLVFTQPLPTSGWEIAVWSREAGARKLRPSQPAPIMERFPTLSPDGRWLAYATNESGRDEVYVEDFPNSTERHPISANGGNAPAWSHNGRELFYLEPRGDLVRMVAVSVNLEPKFRAGMQQTLFEGRYVVGSPMRSYDVAADGRFIMTQDVPQPPAPSVTQIPLVLNWAEELKRLVPTTR